jgi:hypothetical protein
MRSRQQCLVLLRVHVAALGHCAVAADPLADFWVLGGVVEGDANEPRVQVRFFGQQGDALLFCAVQFLEPGDDLPDVRAGGEGGAPVVRRAADLRDACLALRIDGIVGNDVDADGKSLVIVTGANSGGKSTFLRGAGLAQLMMQCGMFVAAGSFRASVCKGVFTHFIREEDASMISGRLDEELGRMSAIADQISRNAGCCLTSRSRLPTSAKGRRSAAK